MIQIYETLFSFVQTELKFKLNTIGNKKANSATAAQFRNATAALIFFDPSSEFSVEEQCNKFVEQVKDFEPDM